MKYKVQYEYQDSDGTWTTKELSFPEGMDKDRALYLAEHFNDAGCRYRNAKIVPIT